MNIVRVKKNFRGFGLSVVEPVFAAGEKKTGRSAWSVPGSLTRAGAAKEAGRGAGTLEDARCHTDARIY